MTTTTLDGTPARVSSRLNVSYTEFVQDFARTAASYLALAFTGIGLIVGSALCLSGGAMVALVAAGLGLSAAGLGGLTAATMAHHDWTRYFATTTTTTYQAPEPTPSVRAFVPSQNGTATIRAGRFRLTRQQWTRLFQSADNGRLTRDGAMKALPRELYRNWADTLGDLARLGIVDDSGIITGEGWRFYNENVGTPPYPNDGDGLRAGNSTHARRTHGAHGAEVSS